MKKVPSYEFIFKNLAFLCLKYNVKKENVFNSWIAWRKSSEYGLKNKNNFTIFSEIFGRH